MPSYTLEGNWGAPIPTKVFSQCTGARIDVYVNWVTTQFSKQFRLSLKGQRNINNALNNLPAYSTPDENLIFGWTPAHALRNRGVAEHAGGYEHVALEGTLSAAFPEQFTAKVLYEMAQLYAEEGDVTPHYDQWRQFVQSSDGIFAATDYGLLVDKYLRLDPHSRGMTRDEEGSVVVASTARRLAEALQTLASLTQIPQQRMTIAGGPLLGWIAAFIDWILDLPFSIFSSQGECLHRSDDATASQILLVYVDDPNDVRAEIASWGQDEDRVRQVSSVRRTIITREPVLRHFGGCVAWNSLLTQAFGDSLLYLLHEQSHDLAVSLGCAARIVSELPDFGDHNLAQVLTTWLPELYRFSHRMEQQLKLSEEYARHMYCERMEKLKTSCGCRDCLPRHTADGQEPHQARGSYCLPALVESILVLGVHLSMLTVAPRLHPARKGISCIYQGIVARRGIRSSDPRNLDTWFKSLLEPSMSLRIRKTIEIFTGYQPPDKTPKNLVALSYEGICVYSLELERPGGGGGGGARDMIRVVNGNICWWHKIFSRACLGAETPGDDWEDFWERINCDHLPEPLYCK